jgi:hypothetical protein
MASGNQGRQGRNGKVWRASKNEFHSGGLRPKKSAITLLFEHFIFNAIAF